MSDPTTIEVRRVQWAQGSGGGVRSWAYHGIGKIHVVAADGYRTLCGRRLPRPSLRWEHDFVNARGGSVVDAEDYCKRCAVVSNGVSNG